MRESWFVDVWPICKASPPLLTTGRPSQLAKKKRVDNNKLEKLSL